MAAGILAQRLPPRPRRDVRQTEGRYVLCNPLLSGVAYSVSCGSLRKRRVGYGGRGCRGDGTYRRLNGIAANMTGKVARGMRRRRGDFEGLECMTGLLIGTRFLPGRRYTVVMAVEMTSLLRVFQVVWFSLGYRQNWKKSAVINT